MCNCRMDCLTCTSNPDLQIRNETKQVTNTIREVLILWTLSKSASHSKIYDKTIIGTNRLNFAGI